MYIYSQSPYVSPLRLCHGDLQSASKNDATIKAYIRREIVHRLCISPATHSQVVKSLPNRFIKAEGDEKSYLSAVDDILKEVATFYRPGTIMLRGTCDM